MFRNLIGRLILVGIYLLIGVAIEDKLSARKIQGRLFNCACTILFLAFDSATAAVILTWMAGFIERFPGRPILFHGHQGVPFVVFLVLLTSIVADFFAYWEHRALHSRWLWPIHELHHADENVNVTTSFRFHLFESPLATLIAFFPAILLPRPTFVIPAAFLFRCANNFWIHFNVPIGLGRFNRVLANPQTHRIHHSRLAQHFDKNFAVVWPIWDVLFGTYYAPKKAEWPPTGVGNQRIQYGRAGMVLRPFIVWYEMIRKSSPAKDLAKSRAAILPKYLRLG